MAHRRHPPHRGPYREPEKKLLAGVRFSCLISGDKEGEWDCSSCDERMRAIRNCRNRRGLRHTFLKGKKEWLQVSAGLKPVLKIADLKYFECPVSCITPRTWQILAFVNETTSAEHTEVHASVPLLEQPPWYREAVQIVRSERSAHRAREMEKKRERRS